MYVKNFDPKNQHRKYLSIEESLHLIPLQDYLMLYSNLKTQKNPSTARDGTNLANETQSDGVSFALKVF